MLEQTGYHSTWVSLLPLSYCPTGERVDRPPAGPPRSRDVVLVPRAALALEPGNLRLGVGEDVVPRDEQLGHG